MNIICPRCGFSRQVPADRLPARAVIATCPHCACRFRFEPSTGEHEVLPDAPQTEQQENAHGRSGDMPSAPVSGAGAGPNATPEMKSGAGEFPAARGPEDDDPLPPGAIVPGASSGASGQPDYEGQSGQSGSAGQVGREDKSGKEETSAGKARPFDQRGSRDDEQADEDPRAAASRAYEREYGRYGSRGGAEEKNADRHDDHEARDARDGHGEYGRRDAYGRHGKDGDSPYDGQDYDDEYDQAEGGIPWETAPEPDGWIAAFYQTCMRVMFGAHRFFSQVQPNSPQMRALIFYLLVSVIQVIVERVWSGVFMSLMAPSAASDPQLEKMLIMLSPQMSLPMVVLLKTGLSVIQLYVLSALINFTYGFVRGNRTDFSQVFQVLAYSAAPTLLCVVPLLGSLVGFVWMVACVLIGCRAALNLSWPQALMGLAPVVLLLAPLILQIFQAARM